MYCICTHLTGSQKITCKHGSSPLILYAPDRVVENHSQAQRQSTAFVACSRIIDPHLQACKQCLKLLLQEFSEWAQCQVLEFATHYRPSDEQEVYDFMNVLDDRLSHSNSAVVMATVKMFLHYTLTMPATHQQVT